MNKDQKMRLRKISLLIGVIILIGIVSFISATDCELTPANLGQQVELTQTCSNCTFVNLTQIKFENNILFEGQYAMTKVGSNFNYTFTPNETGTYYYSAEGDLNGVLTIQTCKIRIDGAKPNNQLFNLDFNNSITIIIFLLFFATAGILMYKGFTSWAGFVIFISALFLFFNGVNPLISVIIGGAGIVIIFSSKK